MAVVSQVYCPVIRPVIVEIGAVKLTACAPTPYPLTHQPFNRSRRYFCRFEFTGTAQRLGGNHTHTPDYSHKLDSFWSAFSDSVSRAHAPSSVLKRKGDEVDSVTYAAQFMRLGAGAVKYSTLCHALAPSDSFVTLILVFRDEVFRHDMHAPLTCPCLTLCAVRRPFSRAAKFHQELCRYLCHRRAQSIGLTAAFRFKVTDDVALVFNFAFLVCSNYKFDSTPAAPQDTAAVQLQAPTCSSTGFPFTYSLIKVRATCPHSHTAAAATPRHLQFEVCSKKVRRVIVFPQHKDRMKVGDVWKGTQASLVTVAINMNPPLAEQPSDDGDDDICLGAASDDDCDF